jgi:single-strand DNA-binding protein
MVYIVGRLKTRKWKDEEGKDRYNTEVHCTEFTFLSPKGDSGNDTSTNSGTEPF